MRWRTALLNKYELCRNRIRIDLFDNLANTQPNRKISEDLDNTAFVGERRFLQDRKVLHHSVVYDVLYDLIDKIDFPVFMFT